MFSKDISTYCPVCKTFLGRRIKETQCAFICQECNRIYVWKPNVLIPENKPITKRNELKCGCGKCGR